MKRIFYTLTLTALFAAFMSFTNKQQQNDPVAEIVDAIAKRNVYEFGKLGFTGLKSNQFDRYLKLCELASNEELVGLLEHRNVVVRIYAFQACEERGIAIPKEVIGKFRRDHNIVKIVNGCEAYVSSVQKLTVGEPDIKGSGASNIRINGGPQD